MDDKTWTVVGTSIKRGEKKLRFANGTADARQKVLEKDGHTEVCLWDLPSKMTTAAATEWLAAQGDVVPVQAPKVDKPKVERTPRERTISRLADELVRKATALAHEDLGRAAHKSSGISYLDWDHISEETRQEMCRNAATAAGIKCPPGTYPELEAMLRKEKVKIMADGTLVQG
jgi:hypothetical protein